MENEQKQDEWMPPKIRQGDRVYVCKNTAQMATESSARLVGFVIGVSGTLCDVMFFKRGAATIFGEGCRHIDDPRADDPNLQDNNYRVYRLADSELDIQKALRQSGEAVAACQELTQVLAGKSRAAAALEKLNEPEKRPRGRPRKEPVEVGDAT